MEAHEFIFSVENWIEAMSLEDTTHALDLLRESLENSKNVSDETIARCFPKIGAFYRNELVRGMELYLEGMAEKDAGKTQHGQRLMDEFRKHSQGMRTWEIQNYEPGDRARRAVVKATL